MGGGCAASHAVSQSDSSDSVHSLTMPLPSPFSPQAHFWAVLAQKWANDDAPESHSAKLAKPRDTTQDDIFLHRPPWMAPGVIGLLA